MTIDDVDDLLQIFSDPVAMRSYPSTMARDGAIAWIRRSEANYRNLGTGFWIVERKDDVRFIGQCGLIPQEVNGSPEIEVAYLFVRKFWRQGYTTEAANACRD